MGGRASVIMVLGFAAIFAMIQYRLSQVGTEAVENMVGYHDEMARHNVAVAGANVALAALYQNNSLRGPILPTTEFYGGSFTARMDSVKQDTFRLQSVGLYRDRQDTVTVWLSGLNDQSFSIFAYMTNIEGNIWWITGDTVWGKLHTNDKMQIYGSPVFMKKVTNVKGFYPHQPGQGYNKAIFKDGYETGVAPKDFPTDLGKLRNAAQGSGYFTTDEVWIKLKNKSAANDDGWIYVYTDSKMDTEPGKEFDYLKDSIKINDPTFNGAFWSENKVHMQGTLDGMLTVGSKDKIYLDDDVMYERIPEPDDPESSDDVLGIVSQSDVIITDNVPNTTSINIHATIFCLEGSFTAENYNSRPISGLINLLGGIVQAKRGPVGTFSKSTGIKSGFSKRYYYDDRLADNLFRPPFYPGFWSKTLRVVSWWE